jgi:putative ABC transport system permease protein
VWRRLLWGSLRSRRGRVGLGLLAVSLGAATATAMATLALQIGDDVALTLRAAGPNFLIQPAGAHWTPDLGGAPLAAARVASGLPESAVARLKQTFWKHNILHATPELSLEGTIAGADARLVGTWFAREVGTADGPWRTGLSELRPGWTHEGRWPREGGNEVALGRSLARRIGARPETTVMVAIGPTPMPLTVTAVLTADGAEDEHAFLPLALVQREAGRPGQVDRIWVSALLKPGPRTPPPSPERDPEGYERYMCTAYPQVVAAEVAAAIPGAEVLPATERIAGEAHVVGRLRLLMLLLAIAALATSTLGLLSTTTAAVVERSTELALLRAIGASPRQLATLLLAETGLVALVGGLAGWWLGSTGAALIRSESLGRTGDYQPLLLPIALLVAGLVGMLGTLGPLRLALRLDPARVLRG